MILKREIERIAEEKGVNKTAIDKDWILGHFIDAIYSIPECRDKLAHLKLPEKGIGYLISILAGSTDDKETTGSRFEYGGINVPEWVYFAHSLFELYLNGYNKSIKLSICTRRGIFLPNIYIFVPERVDVLIMNTGNQYPELPLSGFVKQKRKELGLTQQGLADKAGVGLRFVRELERDKPSLQMDKVNQVLILFGYEMGPVPLNRNKLIHEKG